MSEATAYDAPLPREGLRPEEFANVAADYQPRLGQYLRAAAGEGFWASTTGQLQAWQRVEAADEQARALMEEPLQEQEWATSAWFRPGLAYDPGMTPTRAQALAEVFDENAYRRRILAARRPDVGDQVLAFGAAVAGGLPAVENFIPFAGPAFRGAQALRAARAGAQATVAADVTALATARLGAIGGRATVAATDAALGTALVQPFLLPSRAALGDDVTWADALLDIGLAAFGGAALGGAAGAWAHWRGGRLRPESQLAGEPIPTEKQIGVAMSALTRAAEDVATGRTIDIGADPVARTEIERMAAPDPAAPGADASARWVRATDQGEAQAPRLVPETAAAEIDLEEATAFERLAQAGRVTETEQAAYTAATAQVQRTARLRQAYEAAATCALGG